MTLVNYRVQSPVRQLVSSCYRHKKQHWKHRWLHRQSKSLMFLLIASQKPAKSSPPDDWMIVLVIELTDSLHYSTLFLEYFVFVPYIVYCPYCFLYASRVHLPGDQLLTVRFLIAVGASVLCLWGVTCELTRQYCTTSGLWATSSPQLGCYLLALIYQEINAKNVIHEILYGLKINHFYCPPYLLWVTVYRILSVSSKNTSVSLVE